MHVTRAVATLTLLTNVGVHTGNKQENAEEHRQITVVCSFTLAAVSKLRRIFQLRICIQLRVSLMATREKKQKKLAK
jgi:hypothetical protein